MLIDNGTHLVLSGNYAALSFARTVGSESLLEGPVDAEFPFIDRASNERWTLRFGSGRIPWWLFDKDRARAADGDCRLSTARASVVGIRRQADWSGYELYWSTI